MQWESIFEVLLKIGFNHVLYKTDKQTYIKEQEQFLKLLTEGSSPLKSLPGFGEENINKLVKVRYFVISTK